MSRCERVDGYGDRCGLDAGHEGQCIPRDDITHPNAEDAARLRARMGVEISELMLHWRELGVPWQGIAGCLLGDAVFAYRRAGVPLATLPGHVREMVGGLIEDEQKMTSAQAKAHVDKVDADIDALYAALNRQNAPGGRA